LPPTGVANIGNDPLEYGNEGLAGPTLGLQISDNVFNNVYMSVNACCANSVLSSNIDMDNPVLAWGDVNDYCLDIDKHQLPGDSRQDGWIVTGNTYNFAKLADKEREILDGVPTGTQPSSLAGSNAAFAAKYPNAPFLPEEYCRETFTWTNTNNDVCGASDAGCQISKQ
jgi:hypothetical protein